MGAVGVIPLQVCEGYTELKAKCPRYGDCRAVYKPRSIELQKGLRRIETVGSKLLSSSRKTAPNRHSEVHGAGGPQWHAWAAEQNQLKLKTQPSDARGR